MLGRGESIDTHAKANLKINAHNARINTGEQILFLVENFVCMFVHREREREREWGRGVRKKEKAEKYRRKIPEVMI